MLGRLYLDAARLGLASTSAQQGMRDFVRLTAEEGCSLYFEQLFYGGFASWPAALRSHYPGLKHWQGIPALKESLCRLAEAPRGSSSLLASRSAELMRLAAKLLVERCRRILVTDLSWAGYAAILEREARSATTTELVGLSLRSAILDYRLNEPELVECIRRRFERERCDGLFLPAVTNNGILLPLGRIFRALGHPRLPRFAVIDGAQALCHTGCRPGIELADIYLTGCHKWLQAGSAPLGAAFCPRRRSRTYVRQAADRMLGAGELDDPLLRFLTDIESRRVSRFSETVSLASLFAAQGAAADWRHEQRVLPTYLAWQLANADRIAEAAGDLGWEAIRPAAELRSGILLLQARSLDVRLLPAETLRESFQRQGVTLTAYGDGAVRLSMPQEPLRSFELEDLCAALLHCGGPQRWKDSARRLNPQPTSREPLALPAAHS
jgi:hypothetical protein